MTKPGPLAALMPLPLKDLDQSTVERWAAREGKDRAASARLSWRLLTVFLTWCGEQTEYAALIPAKNPAKTKAVRHRALTGEKQNLHTVKVVIDRYE